jgi:hypothetical protein
MHNRFIRLIACGIMFVVVVSACSKVPGSPVISPTQAQSPGLAPYPQPTGGAQPGNTQGVPYPGVTVVAPPTSESEAPVSSLTLTPQLEQPANWMPQPGDEKLKRGPVVIDLAQLQAKESFPVQFVISLQGSLPTPCHMLRAVVLAPDAQNQIRVDVYSLVDPAKICIQVLQAFQVNVPLQDIASGTYTVWVNSQQIGEIKP